MPRKIYAGEKCPQIFSLLENCHKNSLCCYISAKIDAANWKVFRIIVAFFQELEETKSWFIFISVTYNEICVRIFKEKIKNCS